jgi:hypothetical protein
MRPSQNAKDRKRRSDRNAGLAIRIAASDLRPPSNLMLTAESPWPKGAYHRFERMSNADVDKALEGE